MYIGGPTILGLSAMGSPLDRGPLERSYPTCYQSKFGSNIGQTV